MNKEGKAVSLLNHCRLFYLEPLAEWLPQGFFLIINKQIHSIPQGIKTVHVISLTNPQINATEMPNTKAHTTNCPGSIHGRENWKNVCASFAIQQI